MAAGTLPEAPDIRPSVTRAIFCPRSCSTPSGGVSLCSSGMPLDFGPWKRTTAMKSCPSNSPASNAACNSVCDSNTLAGARITRCSGLTAEVLITALPRFPCSSFKPPSGENASANGRTMFLSKLRTTPTRHFNVSPSKYGSCVYGASPLPI